MNKIYLYLKALRLVVEDKFDYDFVLNKLFNKTKESKRELIEFKNSLFRCLRNFVLLSHEVGLKFPNIDKKSYEFYFLIYIFNEYKFQGEKDFENITRIIIEASDYLELKLDKNEIIESLKSLDPKNVFMIENLKNDSFKYYSIYFSVPLWIITNLYESLGEDKCLKVLLSTRKRIKNYFYKDDENIEVNKNILAIDELKNCYASYSFEGIDEYLKKGNIIPIDYSLQSMMKELSFFIGIRTLYYSDFNSSTVKLLISILKKYNGTVDSFISLEEEKLKLDEYIKMNDLNDVHSFLGGINLALSYSEYESYDLIIVNPKSSSLGLIKRRPDILFTSNEDDIKNLADKAYEDICEASKFICVEGRILFFSQTYTKEETNAVVDRFLQFNKNFVLEKESLILPYEHECDGLYFAIIRRDY